MPQFFKYHGAGNDFILLDNRNRTINWDNKHIARLCHRRLGIGADGLILIEEGKKQNVDFSMRYFNADGNEGTMCGNGGRCALAFAHHLEIIDNEAVFVGIDGLHHGKIVQSTLQESVVQLSMNIISEIKPYQDGFFLNTGSPHVVKFVEDLQHFDVFESGKVIRHQIDGGSNVDFVEIQGNTIFVRTFERGVEDETLSCGTGVTASALIFSKQTNATSPIKVKTLGGNFQVCFKKEQEIFSEVVLEGPTCLVFEGNVL